MKKNNTRTYNTIGWIGFMILSTIILVALDATWCLYIAKNEGLDFVFRPLITWITIIPATLTFLGITTNTSIAKLFKMI